ncbi:troponin C, isoallergen Bla g 6.0201-like [Homalodisca vitripennis]|uniref:troponin C, isoallergen Bla g 6.0201-like n=1 Tax=Homalodisca vitripennis TaxID=197043 RepID=UPI001EEBD1D4|nr:troponin C, isoallergen Bla g 6.0201-like [Homalodisca vitripennis]
MPAPAAAKAPAPADAKKASSGSSSGSSTPDSSGSEENSKIGDLSLTKDQIILLKNAFTAFDQEKKGCIGISMIGTILELLGHAQTNAQLEAIVKEVDLDGSGELEFEEFCILASKFLTEEEEDTNAELLNSELKEAFRFYDRDGNGYITTEDFKEILRELDPEIPESELIGMVNEIDVDDSGTVDFEEFQRALR